MSNAFASSPAKVGDLLSAASLSRERIQIPTFQRGYMWKKKHVEAFWTDVDRQRLLQDVKGADLHFFGPIVTMTDKEQGIVWLLDGQQRLATATSLICTLRDIAREIADLTGISAAGEYAATIQIQFIRDEYNNYSLQMGETDAAYFRDTIQREPPDAKAKAKQVTHRNIKAARLALRDSVISCIGGLHKEMDSLKALEVLRDIKRTIIGDFITARIPVTSQEAAFKIFTTLNDRGLRLSPPDLLLSYLMERAAPQARLEIRGLWTQMIQKMGTHDIHDFLRTMWVSRHGDLKATDLFTALKDYLEGAKITSLDFAKECADECDEYIQLVVADENQLPTEAYPVIKALTRELGIRAAMPLLLSSYLRLKPKDLANVARWLLVFHVRYSIIGNRQSSGAEDLMFKLARRIRSLDESIDDAESARVAGDVKKDLMAAAPDNRATEDAAATVILDHPGEAKYLVNRIARFMQDPQKQVTVGETNVEHIYPQNPAPDGWGGPANQEVLEPLTWSLGNLTIFGKRANRKAANSEYSEKRPRLANSKVVMASSVAARYDVWGEEQILKRARYLAKLVVQIWDFDNPSRV